MLESIGGRGRNRTYNLSVKSRMLCQLSYASMVSGKTVQRQGFHTASAHRFFLLPLEKYSTVTGLSQNAVETRLNDRLKTRN